MSNPPAEAVIGHDWYATHVAARLRDFFFQSTPWQRRLWDAGTLFTLRELLDAARWHSENVLSASSVGWLAHELKAVTGRDPGVGGPALRRRLNQELEILKSPNTRHWHAIEQMLPLIEENYLNRWLSALEMPQPPGAERAARAIATHLLDLGYSQTYLVAWVARHLKEESTLSALLADACDLSSRADDTYEVLLPFTRMQKPERAQEHDHWRSASDVAQWIKTHQAPDAQEMVERQVGGFIYHVSARDAHAALRTIAGIRDRLIARASYVPGQNKMEAATAVWIRRPDALQSFAVSRTLAPERRGAYVRSLDRENKLHDVGTFSTTLDDALELAAALNNSTSRGPAIASGWSALESLLFSPNDPQDSKDGRGVIVCQRAAELVACSWPRAELTALSYAKSTGKALLSGTYATALDAKRPDAPSVKDSRELREQLDTSVSNLGRCQTLLEAYSRHRRLDLDLPGDVAAQERMLALLHPRRTLSEVKNHMIHAFMRMYRMRNIVVHGGGANSSGLEVALRTASPLIGATLDRIAHSQLVDSVEPLALAARASVNLELVGEAVDVASLLA